jgi:hypothetical protein
MSATDSEASDPAGRVGWVGEANRHLLIAQPVRGPLASGLGAIDPDLMVLHLLPQSLTADSEKLGSF